ncbi:BglG family transcription antiterminator [Clostridium sp.]|uniref:BglG family transcription antiterminator n=1 Tax=Clostridium sp. TaxID=1506 RepID=UPI001A4040DB|nr:BglG family transcription antiterminator [Clostridium sp.]MBK5237358.1 BglG family transcription antiterminator [Clostridium sp.]
MSDVVITSRVKEILRLLIGADISNFITVNDIAKKLDLSSRTILREMPQVEKWLKYNHFKFIKKTGVGLLLNENLEGKNRLQLLLDGYYVEKHYKPEERQYLIISELIQMKEPVKLYYFTSIFGVTEGTLSNDLDKVQEWFKKHNLKLVRKPGLGVYIEGKEKEFRQALISLLYENLDENQLLQIIKDNVGSSEFSKGRIEINTRNRLLNLIDKSVIKELEKSVYKVEEKMKLKLADSAYVGLIVHLAIAMQRIKNNERISIDPLFLSELKKTTEYSIAEGLASDISNNFNLEIPEDEIGYITMHLKGSKMQANIESEEKHMIGKYELIKIAKKMIAIAEIETGCSLLQNKNLLMGLVNHLEPVISRLKMKLDIRNPLLTKIKETYPEIYETSRKCCVVLQDLLGVEIPESEIGYIAMHIGAAVENEEKLERRRYRIAVACASGIGTSRLLATRLQKEFKNIEVVDVISTINIKEQWLKEEGIELIISTVIIDSLFKTVIVNPLLLEEDKIKIKTILGEIKESIHVKAVKVNKHDNLKDNIITLMEYGEVFIEIMNNFYFDEDGTINSKVQLIEKVSKIFGTTELQQRRLQGELTERERLGTTILNGEGIILLHCRSEVVSKPQIGVIRLKNIIHSEDEHGEDIDTALVMIAPLEIKRTYIEVISEISKALVEVPEFALSLKDGNKDQIAAQLNRIFGDFYYKMSKLFQEGENNGS